MALLTWGPSYSVGVKEIDDQHKKLIEMLNKLHDAMRSGKAKEETKPILKGLISYTVTHFTAEEKYMEKAAYPELEQHQKIHKEFIDKVDVFYKDFEKGKATISISIMNFLMDWIRTHISGEDKKYTSALNEAGIK